ncbi:MAG: class I SAM-dependent methyltransferase [Halobacteriales archaeon]
MPKAAPFEAHTERYEGWFETHEAAYESELAAIRRLVPDPGYGLEIGVGSGRFAAPLGLQVGVDPAVDMLGYARERGIDVVRGVAEWLPFPDDTFDVALLVTTICFVDDVPRTLSEAGRVIAPDGAIVLGYIDRDSPVGRVYQRTKADSPFYREATFVSTDELLDALEAAGFDDVEFVQTIFHWPGDLDEPDRVEPGRGEGSFVGLRAVRT